MHTAKQPLHSLSQISNSFFQKSKRRVLLFFASVMLGMGVDSRFHVLAVDDSVIDRKLIERLLKTSSFQVTAVDSGIKALQLLGLIQNEDRDLDFVCPDHTLNQGAEINLIITDYSMPGMTGYDLLRKIKSSETLKDIPVVIMSSENIPSRINRCLEEGAEEFLLKPVQLSDVNKLKPHLLRPRLLRPNLSYEDSCTCSPRSCLCLRAKEISLWPQTSISAVACEAV